MTGKWNRYLRRTASVFILAALCIVAGGCSICDWYHDLRYGDSPLPTTPIAPPAAPMPSEYSEDEAAALMADSLIFTLSGLSVKGKPSVWLISNQVPQPGAERVYTELRRSRVIAPATAVQQPKPKDLLLFSGRDKDGNWYMILEYADRSETVFNQTIKLKKPVKGPVK